MVKERKGYEDAVEKTVRFLKRTMRGDHWVDKWHISPYYTTGHAIAALIDVEEGCVERAIDWMLNTQHESGAWGYNGGTVEETAYALQALLTYHRHVERIDPIPILRGMYALDALMLTDHLEELWVAKGLYCPINVVRSAALTVLYHKRSIEREGGMHEHISVLDHGEVSVW